MCEMRCSCTCAEAVEARKRTRISCDFINVLWPKCIGVIESTAGAIWFSLSLSTLLSPLLLYFCTMDKVKLALVGCGNIGQVVHLPILERMTDVELVAVIDPDK